MDPDVGTESIELTHGDPPDVRGFVIRRERCPRRSDHEKTDVEMVVLGFTRRCDAMDVEIDGRQCDLQPSDAGLLGRLPKRCRRHVRRTVDMTAGLQPATEFGVVQHHESIGAMLDDECRRCEVPGDAGSMQCIGVGPGECQHPIAHGALLGVIARIVREMLDHSLEVGGGSQLMRIEQDRCLPRRERTRAEERFGHQLLARSASSRARKSVI